jgi:adenine-specific DNA-methyltransferase
MSNRKQAPRFGLIWEDHPEPIEREIALRLPVLHAVPDKAVTKPDAAGRPHVLIEGDNLHALTALQGTHAGKVDVIYIDPPYNTGHEFRYNDRLVGEDDAWRHSRWISFMKRRLVLARSLLAQHGVAFISIDDHEQAHLKLLCDQVFGSENFITCMPWQKKFGGGQADLLYETHEYILVYARSATGVQPFTAEKEVPNSGCVTIDGVEYFKYKGWLRKEHGRKTSDDSSILFYEDIEDVKGPSKKAEIDTAIARGEMMLDRHASGKHEVAKLQRRKGLRKKVPSHIPLKVYTRDGNDEIRALGLEFDNPKPLALLRYLLSQQVALREDAIILDFFAGSGSTAHAVAQLNEADGGTRQCILVTNNEDNICTEVTHPRVKGVLTGQLPNGKQIEPLPGELRYYRCGFRDAGDSIVYVTDADTGVRAATLPEAM